MTKKPTTETPLTLTEAHAYAMSRVDPYHLDPQQLTAIMNQATGHPSSGPLHEWIPILAERIATTYR